jgi:hypothetical protein
VAGGASASVGEASLPRANLLPGLMSGLQVHVRQRMMERSALFLRAWEGASLDVAPRPAVGWGACDRRQISGLMTMVREEFGRDPQCGDLYLFRGRRGDLLRIPFYDRHGYCGLAIKCLHFGCGSFLSGSSDSTFDHLTILRWPRGFGVGSGTPPSA